MFQTFISRHNSNFYSDRLFFFSSRRRHTRYWRDWSSDVCSSDLVELVQLGAAAVRRADQLAARGPAEAPYRAPLERERTRGRAPGTGRGPRLERAARSEERRVGKEWRTPAAPGPRKTNTTLTPET